MSRVFVIAAHPDDEILGVGGTVVKHVNKGDEVYALVLGEGQTSRWQKREMADAEVLKSLHEDSYKSAKVIGFKEIFFESLPDNRFDSVTLLDVVKIIEKYIEDLKPDIIYTHHSGDLNVDHRVTHQAVLTASRPFGDYSVRQIYGFQTVSATEWNFGSRENAFYPQKFVDITDTFEVKCNAMKEYKSELREFPHPRSLKMLKSVAEVWGATVGLEKAEAFEVIRIVE